MADSREQGVWSGHAGQQMRQEAYTPGDVAHPDRLSLVLNSEGWGSVLDFGCGTALWRRMFPADKWYVGLDQNPDMIAGARQRFPEDEFLLVPGIVDGAKIPMEDGGVDVVFTSAVLQVVSLKAEKRIPDHLLIFLGRGFGGAPYRFIL